MSAYKTLESLFTQLSHLEHIQNIMSWDEATMMPLGGGDARTQAMTTLNGIHHEMLCKPEFSDLLTEAKAEKNLSDWEKANLNWIEKIIRDNTCLPTNLVKSLTEAKFTSEQAWRRYRAENNWTDFKPFLKKTFELTQEAAQIRASLDQKNEYDVLIDQFSPGLTQAIIDPLFNVLSKQLPALIHQITEQQKQQTLDSLDGTYPIPIQENLGKILMKHIGFDFNHGRLDTSHHPFCGGVSQDVRITTRYRDDEFISSMMGICHETGHALYEQGLPQNWAHQPVGHALGMSVHESQSLLIEMQACRSPQYAVFFSKQLAQQFGEKKAFHPENLYRALIQVKPGLIRVDADEVSYPLHVILRYEIERDLFTKKITIDDLPEIWDEKMQRYLNQSTHNNNKDGVMQDVHWPAGLFGYFPAYTIGRLMAAQFFNAALKAHPAILENLRDGNFELLKNWLNKNIHALGSSLDTDALLIKATGETLNPEYFIDHLRARYQINQPN